MDFDHHISPEVMKMSKLKMSDVRKDLVLESHVVNKIMILRWKLTAIWLANDPEITYQYYYQCYILYCTVIRRINC